MNLLERLKWLEEHAIPPAELEYAFTIEIHSPKSEEPWPDQRKAKCPYCSHRLEKIPGSKTKCPFCSKYMYVRSNPLTKSRQVVTAEEVELIDDEWARQNGSWEERLLEKQGKLNAADKLTGSEGQALAADGE